LPRLERGTVTQGHHKLERVAMEEVRTGVIQYTLPTNYEGSPRSTGKG
jgi:DNA-directed RNA polymerase subunit K/omega